MSVHQHINRSTCVPFEDCICRVIDRYTFEVCNNFQLRLDTESSAIHENQEKNGSSTRSRSDSQSCTQEVTTKVTTEDISVKKNTTIGTEINNEESDEYWR